MAVQTSSPLVLSSQHVAIIMDGNGRWGLENKGYRAAGHEEGARRVKAIVQHAGTIGLKTLTLWGFSTDNWKRPKYEVNVLMQLFQKYILTEAEEIHANNVKVTFIGFREELPTQLQRLIKQFEERTKSNTGLHLQLAINYGGRADIVRAVNALHATLDRVITAADISRALSTIDVDDPDLVIRTSGEYRLSGFMPWETMSSELYFIKKHWPEFTPQDLDLALEELSRRSRRHGGLVRSA